MSPHLAALRYVDTFHPWPAILLGAVMLAFVAYCLWEI